MIFLDVLILIAATYICWKGYRHRQDWLLLIHLLLARLLKEKGFWNQLLRVGPIVVIWLMMCHWINTHGWHATAASGILLAMTVALNKMRALEEAQKAKVGS